MNYRQESLKKHAEWRGKIETKVRVPVDSREALSRLSPAVCVRP